MSDKVKIMLVEDHAHLRRSIKHLLEQTEGFEVVGEAGNGQQAIEVFETINTDIILMDVGMPVMDGIEACQQIRRRDPSVKVVMLTSHDNERDIFAALAVGANGYCLKDTNFEHFITVIRAVAAGDLWLDSAIAGKVLRALPQPGAALVSGQMGPGQQKSFEALSQRELEVLRLIVDGLTNQEIAVRLVIGLETVKSHVKSILDKMAVSDRSQAAIKALRQGMI